MRHITRTIHEGMCNDKLWQFYFFTISFQFSSVLTSLKNLKYISAEAEENFKGQAQLNVQLTNSVIGDIDKWLSDNFKSGIARVQISIFLFVTSILLTIYF